MEESFELLQKSNQENGQRCGGGMYKGTGSHCIDT